MILAQRIRSIREGKRLSQGDIEERTGLKRSYVSRLEHGRTIPSIPTLEKFARALEIPLYQLFYDGTEPPKLPPLPAAFKPNGDNWGYDGESAHFLRRIGTFLPRINDNDRRVLLHMAVQLVRRKKS